MGTLLDETSLDSLRFIIKEYKIRESTKWSVFSTEVDVSEYIIQKFVNKNNDYVPPVKELRLLYQFFERYVRKHPTSRFVSNCSGDIANLFGEKQVKDRYRDFKEMTRMSDEEQRSFASGLAGSYISLRKHASGRYFISHVKAIDSFARLGLPICRISRRLSDGGDFTIDGTFCTKNGRIYMVGYDTSSGDINSVNLIRVGEGFQQMKGFSTGFERTGEAYASKVAVWRVDQGIRYEDVRKNTGLMADTEAVSETLKMYVEEPEELLAASGALELDAYSKIDVGF